MKIDLSGMSENMKEWFITMLREEREDALGTADNERLFSKGASSKEAAEMHAANAKENSDYADILERMIDDVKMTKGEE